MKKNKLFAVLVSILMFATVFMSGCAFFKGANKLELTEMPKSTYALTENWKATDESLKAAGFAFSIKLTKGDGEVTTYVYGKAAGENVTTLTFADGWFKAGEVKVFELTDFDLSKAGKNTAKIKGESAICTFLYTVNDLSKTHGFARGSGVDGDPYIIEDATQLKLLDSSTNKDLSFDTVVYAKLANNIDMSTLTLSKEPYYSWDGEYDASAYIGVMKNVELDAAGNRLTNISVDAEYIIMTTTEHVVIKNFNLYYSTPYTFIGEHLNISGVASDNEALLLKGFRTFGSVSQDGNNYALYTTYNYAEVIFEDCINKCNIDGVSDYLAVFAAYPVGLGGKVKFINCENYGEVAGSKVAVFVCNGAAIIGEKGGDSKKPIGSITLINSANYANLYSASTSNVVIATGQYTDAEVMSGTKAGFTADSATVTKYNECVSAGKLNVLPQGNYVTGVAANDVKAQFTVASDKVEKVVVTASYYMQVMTAAEGGEQAGTSLQMIKEEYTTADFTLNTAKECNAIGRLAVKKVDSATDADGTKLANNNNATWGVYTAADNKLYYEVMTMAQGNLFLTVTNNTRIANVTLFAYGSDGKLLTIMALKVPKS